MVALNDRSKFVQDWVWREIDLVQKNPITLLDALNQGTFNELEDEASTRDKLFGSFLEIWCLTLKLRYLTLVFISSVFRAFNRFQTVIEALDELLDLILLEALLHQSKELSIVGSFFVQ